MRQFDMKKVDELFKQLEFRSLGVRVKEILGLTDAFGTPKGQKGSNAYGDVGRLEQSETKTDSPLSGAATAGSLRASPDHAALEIDPIKLRETALALWVLDSNISDPGLEDILQYANTESFSEAREKILAELEKTGLSRVYKEIELPLIPVLAAMHTWGIKIDAGYLKKLSTDYHKELDKLQKEIYTQAGQEFNINSPKQLGEMLFVKMGLKVKGQKKTASGAMSTRESELEKFRELHPIIDSILKYRELQKLLSTYIDSIPTLLEKDGRLHTTFVQTGAVTGRMASHNPNLQNIPIKTELGRNIRKAFISEDGFKLVALDYSQIELRLAAILSGDEHLIDIFKSGRDVHTEVASRVFKVPAENVDKEMRRKAKVINFGILYGMGVNALRVNLGKETSREEAQNFYNEYFNTFTGLAGYLNSTKSEAARLGYTETMFGRRRYFEGIKSKLPFIRAAAERTAINAPIQGTSADMIKLAMIKIDEYMQKNNLSGDARMLLQIHDELIFEVKDTKNFIKDFSEKVREIMQDVLPKDLSKGVPIIANCATGKSWGDMQEE
jgi:DNA polymerase I